MKNIHLLPTDKPSRLIINWEKDLCYKSKPYLTEGTQNIYITSDEEIKEGDKKIILTTDQDLIKDGVQAIDDKFLEWFVKNPSCEEVKTIKVPYFDESGYSHLLIIPKEEPKHKGKELTKEEVMKGRSSAYEFLDFDKKETLEEAAERYTDFWLQNKGLLLVDAYKEGAKWQQERGYSEEEVELIVSKLMDEVHCGDITYGDTVIDFKISPRKWFEQFKKK